MVKPRFAQASSTIAVTTTQVERGMSENSLQTVQHLVQDVISPDVRELKVRIASLEKQIESLQKYMDTRFHLVDQKIDSRFDASDQRDTAQFQALMAAISESRAVAEISTMRVVASLSERVAALEAQRP